MIRRPPRSTRTDTLFPYTTLFRSISRIRRCKGFCVRYGFDKRHCAFGNLPKCANDLWMSAMADEHDVPSGFHLPLGLTMHLGHERAGGVQIGKTPRLSRSEERRVGKECVSTGRSRGVRYP